MNEEIEIKNPILEFLIEKGPLGAVVLSVVFNIAIGINELLKVDKEKFQSHIYFYMSIIMAATAFFFVILLFFFFERKTRQNYTAQILDEKNVYDLEEQGETVKVICRQNYEIIALDKMDKFRTFYPIYGKHPVKLICEEGPDGKPYVVTSEPLLKEPNGVNLPLRHSLIKKDKRELPLITWEYENLPSEKAIRTAIIARPTSKLEIYVNLPAGKPRPNKYEWHPVNEEGDSVGRSKKTKCTPVGDRYCLHVEIKNVEVGLSYRIFWS